MSGTQVRTDLVEQVWEECDPASLGIYLVIQSLKNGTENGHLPCQATIAERARVTRSAARRHLTYLARAGFLEGVERMKLTERQLEVLEFIEDYVEEHHCSPTIEEVREGCGSGSYSATWKKIDALDRGGFIEKEPRTERGIGLS